MGASPAAEYRTRHPRPPLQTTCGLCKRHGNVPSRPSAALKKRRNDVRYRRPSVRLLRTQRALSGRQVPQAEAFPPWTDGG